MSSAIESAPGLQQQQPLECSICLGMISNRAVLDPCRHEFDYNCIKMWFTGSSNCPVCRCPVKLIHYSIVSDREYSEEIVQPIIPPDEDGYSDGDGYYDEDFSTDDTDDMGDGLGSDEDGADLDFDSDPEYNDEFQDSDEEWEDISDEGSVHEDGNITDPEEDMGNDDSVQIIGENVGIDDETNETFNETVSVSDDDDDRPITPDYGDDPGDDGQSDGDVYEDIEDDNGDEDGHIDDDLYDFHDAQDEFDDSFDDY